MEASALRLPVIDGSKMDIQEVKAAVNSASQPIIGGSLSNSAEPIIIVEIVLLFIYS